MLPSLWKTLQNLPVHYYCYSSYYNSYKYAPAAVFDCKGLIFSRSIKYSPLQPYVPRRMFISSASHPRIATLPRRFVPSRCLVQGCLVQMNPIDGLLIILETERMTSRKSNKCYKIVIYIYTMVYSLNHIEYRVSLNWL